MLSMLGKNFSRCYIEIFFFFFQALDNIWTVSREKVPSNIHKMHSQIILCMRNVSSGLLLSIHTFCSSQCYCLRTVKVLIRLRGCAVWSGPSLSAYYAQRHVFVWRGPYANKGPNCTKLRESLQDISNRFFLRNQEILNIKNLSVISYED